MNVLFLDIDGVLSHLVQRYAETDSYINKMDKYKLKVLSNVQKESNFKIVITSTWRLGLEKEEMEDIFIDNGSLLRLHEDWRTKENTPYSEKDFTQENFTEHELKNIQSYDYMCPEDLVRMRGFQIHEWLNRHKEVNKFLIIDDDSDMAPFISSDELINDKRYYENFLHVVNGEFTGGLNPKDYDFIKEYFKD